MEDAMNFSFLLNFYLDFDFLIASSDIFGLQSQPSPVLKHNKIMLYIIMKKKQGTTNFQSLTLGLKLTSFLEICNNANI